MSKSAYENKESKLKDKINQRLLSLPDYVRAYVYDLERTVLPSTLYGYINDFSRFLQFLMEQNPTIKSIQEITPELLNQLTIQDFNEFFHARNMLGEKSLARYTSSLKSVFTFLLQHQYITSKEFHLIKTPAIHKKETITYLDGEELNNVFHNILSGSTLTDHQRKYCEKDKIRDFTIIMLLSNTGLRVSECANLDITDFNMDDNQLHLVRKTKKESNIYFSEALKDQLQDYLLYRETIPTHSPALFLNNRQERLSERSIERIVKKYIPDASVHLKHISPHKLRSSYGMALYQATDDIYMVADALGHESVETTKNYYTTVTEERKRKLKNIDLFS